MKSYLLSLLLILSTFLIQAASLHRKPSHQQTTNISSYQQQQKYLDQLLALQSSLKQQVHNIKTETQELNTNLSTYSKLPTVQAQMLKQGVQKQRQLLYEMASTLKLPENRKFNCRKLSEAQSKEITEQIIKTQKQIQKIQYKLNLQESEDCLLVNQLRSQIRFLQNYINQLSIGMTNICERQTTNKFYIINSDATDFTYGKNPDSKQKYEEKVKQYMEKGYLKVECSREIPYPHLFDKCVTCPTHTYYDISQNFCLACPNKYYFDTDKHKCQVIILNSNPNTSGNYIGTMPENSQQADTCPLSKPYFNGIECIQCSLPSFFDFKTKTCKQCKNGLSFLKSSKTCGYEQYNTNTQAATNVCCGAIPVDPALKTCPSSSPYFNGKQCITCSIPTYFNLINLLCSLCPFGTTFSSDDNKCVDQKDLKKVGSISLINDKVQNYQGSPPPPNQNYEIIKTCPQLYPFFNNKHCIACSLPSYFNFNTFNCEVCSQSSQFNITAHKCEQKRSNIKMNSNFAIINNFKGPIPNYQTDLPTCPDDNPYFDGSQCISCALPFYINLETHQCVSCKEGAVFSPLNHECQIVSKSHYTKISADNIYYHGNFTDIINQIASLKSNNPSLKQCPSNIPFFNKIKGQCQNCPSQYPLFDIKNNRCINCTGSSEYNSNKRICISNVNNTSVEAAVSVKPLDI